MALIATVLTALPLGLAVPAADAVGFTRTSVTIPGTGLGTESGLGLSDFNRDGRTDIVATTFSGQLSVLLRGTDGGYAHAPASPHTLSTSYAGPLAVADLNGDDRDDLLVLREAPSGPDVAVLLGTGDGSFAASASASLPGSAVNIRTGDLNGDGNADLVAITDMPGGSKLAVRLGNGDGTFGPVRAALTPLDGTYPSAIALGDFDGDGRLDAAVAHTFTPTGIVSVLRGNGAGDFTSFPGSPYDIGSGTMTISTGDLNGDGHLDLAAPVRPVGGSSASSTPGVLLGTGDGGFRPGPSGSFATPPETNPSAAFALPLGDFDGDGTLDTLIAMAEAGAFPLLGNGLGGFQPIPSAPLVSSSIPTAALIGDLDGNGRPDLVVANSSSTSTLRLFVNDAAPAIAVDPSATLAAAPIGGTTSGTVRITNPGDYGLRIGGLTLGGADPADFAVDGCTTRPIPAGGSCDATVTFAPRAAGPRTATLTIASDADSAPLTSVVLSATGTAPPPDPGGGGNGGGGDPGGGSGGGSGGAGGGTGGGSGGAGGGGTGGGSGTGPGTPTAPRPAALRLTVRPARRTVTRGGRTRIVLTVANRGGTAARNVTLCPRPRTKQLTAGKCIRLGTVRAGRQVRRTVTVRLKRTARPGSRHTLSVTVRATGVRATAARVVLTARR